MDWKSRSLKEMVWVMIFLLKVVGYDKDTLTFMIREAKSNCHAYFVISDMKSESLCDLFCGFRS